MKRKILSRKTNNSVISSWLILAFAIFFTYLINCAKGNTSLLYVLFYCVISFVPIIIISYLNRQKNDLENYIKYLISLGYILFYTFILVTCRDNISFIYIIPMIATLIVYNDKLLIGTMCFYAAFINFIYIIVEYLYGYTNDFYMNLYYVQITSVLLSGIFLYKATDILKINNDKLYELSEIIVKDPLTDAYNRKFVNDNFDEFIESSGKAGVSLAILDIDNFKKFNTDYGHDFGDVVLKTLSAIIIKIISKYDNMYFVRLGGDEFAIIAVNANFDKFVKLLDSIRIVIQYYQLRKDDENVSISISLGAVNSKKAHSKKFETLYKKADINLYKAKELGKNLVVK